MDKSIKSKIEDIEYRADEIKSLLLALEQGIFGKEFHTDSFRMGYSCVFNMVSDLHETLNELKKDLFGETK